MRLRSVHPGVTVERVLAATGFAAVYGNQSPLGFLQGQVLSGGSIDVVANKGSVIAETGSVLDVSSGGYVQPNGTIEAVDGIPVGKGGSISLETYAAGGLLFGAGGRGGNGGTRAPTHLPIQMATRPSPR